TLGRVIEAKYTSSDAQQTKRDYMAQLQWYYMLGADQVFLNKGYQGEPFEINDAVFIEPNQAYIKKLIKGIKLVDAFCETFVYEPKDEWGIEDLLPFEQSAVVKMTTVLSEIKRMEQEAEELKSKLLDTML